MTADGYRLLRWLLVALLAAAAGYALFSATIVVAPKSPVSESPPGS